MPLRACLSVCLSAFLQCALQFSFYQQLAMYLVLPMIAVVVPVLCFGLWYLVVRRKSDSELIQRSASDSSQGVRGEDSDAIAIDVNPQTSRKRASSDDEHESVISSATPTSSRRAGETPLQALRRHAMNRTKAAILVLLFMIHDKTSEVSSPAFSVPSRLSSAKATSPHDLRDVVPVFTLAVCRWCSVPSDCTTSACTG